MACYTESTQILMIVLSVSVSHERQESTVVV